MKPLSIALGFTARFDDYIPNFSYPKLYSDSSAWIWALVKQLQDQGIKTRRLSISPNIDYGKAYFYHSEQDRYQASLNWLPYEEDEFEQEPPNAVILEHQLFDEKAAVSEERIIKACNDHKIPLFLIDSYDQLSENDIKKISSLVAVLDFGNKWVNSGIGHHIEKPIYYKNLFDIKPLANAESDTILVPDPFGMCYAIGHYGVNENKYLPLSGVTVATAYGPRCLELYTGKLRNFNFLSKSADIETYQRAYAAALFGDTVRSKYGTISSNFINCLIYGTIPMFFKDNSRVDVYCPDYLKDPLLFSDLSDYKKVKAFSYQEKQAIIKSLREHVEFMDAKYCVESILKLL